MILHLTAALIKNITTNIGHIQSFDLKSEGSRRTITFTDKGDIKRSNRPTRIAHQID